MKQFLFRLLFALPPYFFGTLIQTVPFPSQTDRLENLFWGSVYGLGWFEIGFFVNLRSSGPAIFGFCIWPIAVSIFLYWIAGKLWDSDNVKLVRICVILLLLSFCIDVPLTWASKPPLAYLPLWYNAFFNIY
ncbi:MAG TPA: hypothetical protein VGG36_03010 [Rhizomicrobium sp.]